MSSESPSFEVIVRDIEHEGRTFDVRCFLVPHVSRLVLIDIGLPGAHGAIGPALDRLGAGWDDITDIVLTP